MLLNTLILEIYIQRFQPQLYKCVYIYTHTHAQGEKYFWEWIFSLIALHSRQHDKYHYDHFREVKTYYTASYW